MRDTMSLVEKARVLHEALPYIKRYSGRTVVVKYGGSAMTDTSLKASFVADVVLLHYVGLRPVIVHGGGPQISELMRRLDQEPVFHEGYRITGAEELDVVRMVLQKTNKDIVSLINSHGDLAVGISGEDGNLLRARKMASEGIDLGFVGEVESVDARVVTGLLASGFIPVVAPIGVGPGLQPFNINADHVAGAIAATLRAEKLVYLTDVEGLMEGGNVLSRVTPAELRKLIAEGTVSDGMIPKATSCIAAIAEGVGRAHIIDGRVDHALLLEIFTDTGVGTMVSTP